MITLNKEEVIRLINNGFDLELLSFELDLPIEEIEECKQRLQLRKFAKESIKAGKIAEAIDKLNNFISTTESNIVERTMLLKLDAYKNRTVVSERDLQEIEEERKQLGFPTSIDEILDELKLQIPKRKSSNIRKKEQQSVDQKPAEEEQEKEEIEKETINIDYDEMIKRYRAEISSNPNAQGKRNLLAFAYISAGKVEEGREELKSLIKETDNYTAYRQLIHMEKVQGNFEDAKLWAYEALDKFPDDIKIKELLISIAKAERDDQEVITQLKSLIKINPENEKNKERLKAIIDRGGR